MPLLSNIAMTFGEKNPTKYKFWQELKIADSSFHSIHQNNDESRDFLKLKRTKGFFPKIFHFESNKGSTLDVAYCNQSSFKLSNNVISQCYQFGSGKNERKHEKII